MKLSKDILDKFNRYAIKIRYPGETATKIKEKRIIQQIKLIRKELLIKLA